MVTTREGLAAGHLSMIADPQTVAEVIGQAASH